jgi:hypothetical protein
MYAPVLQRLKNLVPVPFAEELDDQLVEHQQLPTPFAESFVKVLTELRAGRPPAVAGLEGQLDEGQREGAIMALTQRVTLIQGPPGTGKTYIGTYIASLLANPQLYGASGAPLKILCVTYTNHAVDDFSEGLLKCGIRKILRLGGRASNDVVEPYTLQSKKKSVNALVRVKNYNFNRRFAAHKQRLEEVQAQVEQLQDDVQRLANLSPSDKWALIQSYLEDQGNSYGEELTLNDGATTGGDDDGGGGDADDDGGKFEVVAGGKGKRIRPEFLFKEWMRGAPKPAHVASLYTPRRGEKSCWDLSKAERIAMADRWVAAIVAESASALTSGLRDADAALSDFDDLNRESDFTYLEDAQIILCTTTGAAKNEALIRAAGCDVVLVEEAGEILETHVLSSIYREAKALIMIGDHKQLRPKVRPTCSQNVNALRCCDQSIDSDSGRCLDTG